MKHMCAIVLFAAFSLFSQSIIFDSIPGNLHFYPRKSDNTSDIVVKGRVVAAGKTKVAIALTRNGLVIDTLHSTLSYDNSSANFRLSPVIKAELAEYGIRVWLDDSLCRSVDSIVCGDVILINGQSNSISNMRDGETHEYVRTYEISPAGWTYGKEGDWAQRVGLRINQNHNLPVAIINNGASTTGIAGHLPPSSGLYNGLVARARDGGVQKQAKMILWYQGELDCQYLANMNTYASNFNILYTGWMTDFPGIQKVYVCQINMWEKSSPELNFAAEIRNIHRKLQDTYSNLEVLATVGTPYYDGHYSTQGYRILGERIYGLINRDFYAKTFQPELSSPNIRRAFYSNAGHTEVKMVFDQPVLWKDSDGAGHLLKDYLYLDTVYGNVTAGSHNLAERTITLTLNSSSSATKLRYLPHGRYHGTATYYIEPVLRNEAGHSAFSFDGINIAEPTAGDTGTVSTIDLSSQSSSVEQYSATQLNAKLTYSSGFSDTNNMVKFTSLDTFTAVVTAEGKLFAKNRGLAKISAFRGGKSDTLTLTVVATSATITELKLRKNSISSIVGDKFSPGLIGVFSSGSGSFEKQIDSIATWTFDLSKLSLNSGTATAVAAGLGLKLIAAVGSLKETLTVDIYSTPSIIKRINFQPTGEAITKLEGWQIDSTQVYSSSNGFGFLGIAPRSGNLYEGNHLLKTYNYPAWNRDSMVFKIDVPDGKYIIRIASGSTFSTPPSVVYNGDTIHKNITPVREANNSAYFQHGWSDKAITVSGGNGVTLTMRNKICYLVLISDDGAPMDLAAQDGNPVVAPPNVSVTNGMVSSEGLLIPAVYPNPFNPSVTVTYYQPPQLTADYSIYNLKGQLIRRFDIPSAGFARQVGILWNGRDVHGSTVAGGCYLGRLTIGGKMAHTSKLIFTK
ncbi:MAG: Ig-like domain-containing protein [Fibrobacteres bacterium]|nr:Ig-like domain-containing protein [Fibrobacterota bacterium]